MMTSDKKRYEDPSVGGGVTPGAGASVRLAALRGGGAGGGQHDSVIGHAIDN